MCPSPSFLLKFTAYVYLFWGIYLFLFFVKCSPNVHSFVSGSFTLLLLSFVKLTLFIWIPRRIQRPEDPDISTSDVAVSAVAN